VQGKGQRDVIFLHGIEVWKKLDRARAWALAHAHLLCNSASTLARAKDFNPHISANIVHLGCTLPKQTGAMKASVKTVVMLGRMSREERYKGHDEMIDAWSIIRTAIPDAMLIIIGHGNDLDRLRAKASSTAGIEFKTQLSDAERDVALERAHMLAFPSTGEGFGLAAIEAAALGVPLLALEKTVLAEIFPPGSGSYFAREQEAQSLAGATIAALSDDVALIKNSSLISKFVQANFNQAQFEKRLWNALQELGFGDA
jgi:glycosyltransferase involved in cell wall biosynthesis